MKKLTREQILDLRNSFGVWQQDYDSVHDKEQHDMFALAVVAMDEMLAGMNGEDAERREWVERGAEMEARIVKLPDLRQVVSGDRYVWSDGIFNYIQDLKTVLASAGIKWESE